MDHVFVVKDDKVKTSIVHDSASGLLLGVFSSVQVIACAMIIFSGGLVNYLPMGIGVALVSSIIIGLYICIKSSSSTMIASVQDIYCVITAVILSTIHTSLLLESPNLDPLPTLIASFTSLTIIFGLSMYLLGQYKLGKLIRFIPYPVISGFLAATGWLLLKAGFLVVTNAAVTFEHLSSSWNEPLFLVALIGLAYALFIFVVANKYKHPFILFILIVLATGGFYLLMVLNGMSIDKARALNLLLQVPKHGLHSSWGNYAPFITLLNPSSWQLIQWHLLLNNGLQYLVLIALGSIEFLLNISAIEVTQQRDLDVDNELKQAGIANCLAGSIGGFGGYHELTGTSLNHFLGVKTRLSGLAFLGVFVFLLISGMSVLSLLPKVVFGILIFYSGIWFLHDWLILSWKRFSRFDFIMVLVIFLSIVCINLLTGFVIGLIMAVIIFTMNYSRIKIISAELDGLTIKSNVERAANQESYLQSVGDREYILILKGFLFFGNINFIIDKVKKRLVSDITPCKYVIMDCSMISGMDSSATLALVKLMQYARLMQVEIVLCALPLFAHQQLDELANASEYGAQYHAMVDLDRGLEWVENQLLQQSGVNAVMLSSDTDHLWRAISKIIAAGPYFERICVDKHEVIYKKDDPSDGFYYIESGCVEVILPQEDKHCIRIRSMQKGTIIGEIGMYLGHKRSANVRSVGACSLLFLSSKQLSALEEAHPELAQELDRRIIIILANRLYNTNQLLATIKRETIGT